MQVVAEKINHKIKEVKGSFRKTDKVKNELFSSVTGKSLVKREWH